MFQAPKRGEFRTPVSSAAGGKDIFGDKNTSLLNAATFETATYRCRFGTRTVIKLIVGFELISPLVWWIDRTFPAAQKSVRVAGSDGGVVALCV
ncbi:MAG: hypothetical protein JWR23_1555 [Mucilaginibacter sp.]|nr:hypothetical protein [Mucilaginibacter sp.]